METNVGSDGAMQDQQIGQQLTNDLSETPSRLFQHLEARYGLDTRQTVVRMLSEYTEMVRNPTLNTSDRTNQSRDFWNNLSTLGLTELDKAYVLCERNNRSSPNWSWSAVQHKNGRIQLTTRRKPR